MLKALGDDSGSVRVAAARALARMGHAGRGLPLLVRELREGPQWVRLGAAVVLGEMDADARPALDAMTEALEPRVELFSQGKYTVRVINRAINELLGTNRTVK